MTLLGFGLAAIRLVTCAVKSLVMLIILLFVSTQIDSGLEIGSVEVFGKCYNDAVTCV